MKAEDRIIHALGDPHRWVDSRKAEGLALVGSLYCRIYPHVCRCGAMRRYDGRVIEPEPAKLMEMIDAPNQWENDMRIGDAVEALEDGKRVQRVGWNGKGMWLEMRDFEYDGLGMRNSVRVVLMKTAQGTYVPWLCSQSDLLASDWSVLEEG